MRKNVKQQLALRVLSTAALMAMVSSIATAAFADTYDLNKGSVDIFAADGEQRITQWEDKDNNLCVKDDKGEIRNRLDDDITLTTKNKTTDETETTGETKPTSNTVTIDAKEGNTANVTLQDVHIEVNTTDAKSGAIEIKGDGDTNLELNGDNTVLVENEWSEEHAAIEKADKYGKGTLTIKDDLNDDGSVKDKDENGNAVGGDTGKLLAGGYQGSAAIGGGAGEGLGDTSNITITGGEITASGGHYGAGVGSGNGGDASNIRIEGNAHVTAFADGGAAIGAGEHGSSDVTITDHATVDAAGRCGAAIGLGNTGYETTITISGNATVNAEGVDCTGAIGSGRSGASKVTVNIKDNANVTAIADGVAIGNSGWSGSSTTISITGGTVDAVAHFFNSKPAIGTAGGNLDLTINSSTGKTTVNAYTTSSDPLSLSIGTGHYDSSSWTYITSPSEGAEYNEDGSSNLGESNAAIINSYRNATLSTGTYNAPKTLDDGAFQSTHEVQGTLYNAKHILSDKGDLYKVVHNRKYMEEHPEVVDITKLKDEDLHDWKLVGEVVKPTTEKDGYADYICSIDKCGQTKHVVLPKLTPEPSEPDTTDPDVPGGNTPNTPNKPDTPKQPDGTTPAPVTPDAPVQDAVPDTAPADPAVTPDAVQADAAPADAAVTPAAAQNVVQDAKPEAAATAAVSAAALPQTGANWLAVAGSALSGLFLLAAGFVLDRKGRRMN